MNAPAGSISVEVERTTELEAGALAERATALDLDAEQRIAFGAFDVEGSVRFHHELHAVDADDTEHERVGRLRARWDLDPVTLEGAFTRLRERFPLAPERDEDRQDLRVTFDLSLDRLDAEFDVERVSRRFPHDPDDDRDEIELEAELARPFALLGWDGVISGGAFWERFRPAEDDEERRLHGELALARAFGPLDLDVEWSMETRAFPRNAERRRHERELALAGSWRVSDALLLDGELESQRRRFPNDPEDDRNRRLLTFEAEWERADLAVAGRFEHRRRRFPLDPDDDRDQTTVELTGHWQLARAELDLGVERRRRRFPHDPAEDEDRWTLTAEAEIPWRDALTWAAFAELEETRFPHDPAAGEIETAFGLEVELTF